MASGVNTSNTLSQSLPSIISSARLVREYKADTWEKTTDVRRQQEGTGLNWQEIDIGQIQAQDITETTLNENPQQYADTLLSVEPDMVQVHVKETDRMHRKIANVVDSKLGPLARNSMDRKKDEDYLSLFSGFATTASPGAGNPISFGHVTAAVSNIESNTTEPSFMEIYSVMHGFVVKDIQDEILAGVGTYTVPNGMTEEVFRKGFRGTIAGSNVMVDGNITIDGSDDTNNATHSKEAVVSVMGMTLKTETRRDPAYGGGADELFITDEYGYVERSAGNWAYLHVADATAPTS